MTKPYYQFNREERNHAAILYHLLLSDVANLGAFMDLVKPVPPLQRPLAECEVYFEFAMLRDEWDGMNDDERRSFVLPLLPVRVQQEVQAMGILEWNDFFRASPRSSSKRYQSPARWVPARMPSHIVGEDYAEVNLVKWCFNIKPDLVIITGDKQAICIEAKLESGVSNYPSSNGDIAQWRGRQLTKGVSQLECQRYLFEKAMGFDPFSMTYVVLEQRSHQHEKATSITWKQLFAKLDAESSHPFVRKWLAENRYMSAGYPS